MGFSLKKAFKKVSPVINPLGWGNGGPKNGIGKLFGSGGGGDGGPNFGFTDPNSVQETRKSLAQIMAEMGPLQTQIYDEALRAGEAARAREENRATDNIMGGLQGRGLLNSGITTKDIIEKNLGPSVDRANSLAQAFYLPAAQERSRVLGEAALSDQNMAGQWGLTKLGGAINERQLSLQDQINQRRAMEERRRQRKTALSSGLLGAAGGAAGGYFGGPAGASAGQQIGSSIGSMF